MDDTEKLYRQLFNDDQDFVAFKLAHELRVKKCEHELDSWSSVLTVHNHDGSLMYSNDLPNVLYWFDALAELDSEFNVIKSRTAGFRMAWLQKSELKPKPLRFEYTLKFFGYQLHRYVRYGPAVIDNYIDYSERNVEYWVRGKKTTPPTRKPTGLIF